MNFIILNKEELILEIRTLKVLVDCCQQSVEIKKPKDAHIVFNDVFRSLSILRFKLFGEK